jgi:chromosome segregation protein
MRLERLEISGFKSFSDRTELAFDGGVTAIVGPNGCGKSNVADALTWVLGEQSAKSLRGDKMEDVIFNGSDARKPGGAAEVRLLLAGVPARPVARPDSPAVDATGFPSYRGPSGTRSDAAHDASHDEDGQGSSGQSNGHAHGTGRSAGNVNGHTNGHANGHNGHQDGHGSGHSGASDQGTHHAESLAVSDLLEAFTRDVEVTRRLYRSGESEYLIDGEVCRLRDVHELLMDTGLGAKAYAIIEQGKIGMILSSRPTDRRQLIEEAAGITKYRSRRRAAELKLEAAQQNLTRIDDIVFEVEKQRGALKRQAAKARRYGRLREELRRWEKVLLARRYRELAQTIESTRARLADARERDAAAAARVAELESDLSRLRIEQAEAETRATRVREDAHARELEINRRQQHQEFSRQQADGLAARCEEIAVEVSDLHARREPARLALDASRQSSLEGERTRDAAAETLTAIVDEHGHAHGQIEGLEAEVERARSEVFTTLNTVTALTHAVEHALAQFDRVGETLATLDVESHDLRREMAGAEAQRAASAEARQQANEVLERIAGERASREASLVGLRSEHEARTLDLRGREQEVAAAEARLQSLRELASSRVEFSDAARMVLVQANGHVGQRGAVADYVEVDGRYERAVEACLGDLLQHVIVERHEQAAAGLSLVRAEDAGRCGFVVIDPGSNGARPPDVMRAPGIASVSDLVHVSGPHAAAIHSVISEAYVADSFDLAVAFSRQTSAPVATLDGDVFRGPHLVSGGVRAEARGILATRREIKDLDGRLETDRALLSEAAGDVRRIELAIVDATGTIAALQAEQHRQEMALVGIDAQLTRAREDADRHARRAELLALERRRADEERAAFESRRASAATSIVEVESQRRLGEAELGGAQRRLAEAREAANALSARLAEARAVHAGLVERAAAQLAEVARLDEGSRDLEARVVARGAEAESARFRREQLLAAIADGERGLDDDVRGLETLRAELVTADARVTELRAAAEAQETSIREARRALEDVRALASGIDLARATAESDLSHLAQSSIEGVQATLDEVLADVERMESAGEATPDPVALAADEAEGDGDGEGDVDSEADSAADGARVGHDAFRVVAAAPAEVAERAPGSMTAEEAIVRLKAKIERLGPVNMMAIQQSDELESRHVFLTTQRRDLVDSIAQTSEAIARIDETTTVRFAEALAAIQANFQVTFSTLFGGGRAGLSLLDENDPLESGIDIVASPPGKRLQSVQLLSGGEKALTAIALMFAIFRYKPSPFCLLDEIDAPLDDANVGRFVEMLRGMLDRTQFILITHNRRTMEIANRLYGVTMEEPGVSKLISVQLH